MYELKSYKKRRSMHLNSFTQIINYIMYIIDLIQSWFATIGDKDANNNVDDKNSPEIN